MMMLSDSAANLAARPVCVAVALALCGPALAQQRGPGMSSLEEIVVTARRRDEGLQEVPLNVTAFTGEMLERRGLTDLSKIALATAGFDYIDFGGGMAAAPTLRGLTQINAGVGETNVGIFLDGIYLADRSGLNIGLLDLERVEIVRGPQSALYGRNTFGGAINYVTRQPTEALSASVRAGVGSSSRAEGRAAISGPIVGDHLSGRLSLGYEDVDGSWRDPVLGQAIGGGRRSAAHGSLVFTPLDNLEINLGSYYSDQKLQPSPIASQTFTGTGNNCAPSPFVPGAFLAYCGQLLEGDELQPQTAGNPLETANESTASYTRLGVTWQLAPVTVDWLSGFNRSRVRSYRENNSLREGLVYTLVPGPGTISANTFVGNDPESDSWSTELRLSSPDGARLSWMVGGYLFDFDGASRTTFAITPLTPLPAGQALGGPFAFILNPAISLDGTPSSSSSSSTSGTRQRSLFASSDFAVTEQFTVGAQLRYTEEDKTSQSLSNAFAPGAPPRPKLSSSFDFVDWRLGADYQLTPAVMVYASAARGTHAGGFNANATAPQDRTFDPEYQITYEAGVKSTWLDGRMQANATAYYIDWEDLQLPGPNSDPTNPNQITRNFASAENLGLELELEMRVTERLTLSGSASLSDAKFASDTLGFAEAALCARVPTCAPNVVSVTTPQGPRNAVQLDGFKLPRQSPVQFTTAVDYVHPVGRADWEVLARADFSYKDTQYVRNDNFATIGTRQLLGLRLGVQNERYSVMLWGDNLLDDVTPTILIGGQFALNVGAQTNDVVLPVGRMYGLSFTARL